MGKQALVVALLLAVGVGLSAEAEVSPAAQQAILDKIAPSIVRLEYTLQFDKGEGPSVSGWLQATYDELGFVMIFAGVSFFYATAITLQWIFFKRPEPSHKVEQPVVAR